MKVIRARNVHQALPEGLHQIANDGVPRESRNGPVIVFPEPVTTVYERPAERVMFWPAREANPFFHFFESLWMLRGRNDVEFVARFVDRMRSFSDDGLTFHGAYGFRWRYHFGFDQLPGIIRALRKDPTDRRQVLSMWDTRADLGRIGKDLPCNLQAIFQVTHDGQLDMTVTNRSNDMILGAYGANAVHFSYLHEYMARSVGVAQGIYRQVSANLHCYVDAQFERVKNSLLDVLDPNLPAEMRWAGLCPYEDGAVEPFPLIQIDLPDWEGDLDMFLDNPGTIGFRDPFFKKVAVPLWNAHAAYKSVTGVRKFDEARSQLERCQATDWQMAAREWIDRRQEVFLRAQDDGVRSGQGET